MIAGFIKLGAILDFSVQIFIFMGNNVFFFHNATLFICYLIFIFWASVFIHSLKWISLKRVSCDEYFSYFNFLRIYRNMTCHSITILAYGILLSFWKIFCHNKQGHFCFPFLSIWWWLFFVRDDENSTQKLTSLCGETWVLEWTKAQNAEIKMLHTAEHLNYNSFLL